VASPIRWRIPGGWRRGLLAILLGNLLFHSAERTLPLWARHEPFALDGGLLIDFLLCVGLYGASFLLWPRRDA
jgi:hypothetical protein